MKSSGIIMAAAGLVVVVAVLIVMVEARAREELAMAQKAVARADYSEALKHYSRCLSWYLPGGTAENAAGELFKTGLALARQGRDREAGLALDRMRSGLSGARSLFTPRLDLVVKAEPVLARLRAREKLGPKASPSALKNQARVYLEIMRRPSRPAIGPALAATSGFLLWVAAALAFVFAFFRTKGRTWSRAWPWVVIWAAGFSLWLWGLKWA